MPAPIDEVAQSIMAASKRGAVTNVTFSADAIISVLTRDYRWTQPQVVDFIRCLRRATPKAKAS